MAQCQTPFVLTPERGGIPVPCGKCPACVKRRASWWSFRLVQEDKTSAFSRFITLTYDTNEVPITQRGYMSLNKKDVQDFFKRLRKSLPGTKIRYFAVGEYGGRTMRPHYHFLFFINPKAQPVLTQSVSDIENAVTRAWGNGNVHFGNVSGASVGYSLKYISKAKKIPLHANDDRIREFAVMSKALGRRT